MHDNPHPLDPLDTFSKNRPSFFNSNHYHTADTTHDPAALNEEPTTADPAAAAAQTQNNLIGIDDQ